METRIVSLVIQWEASVEAWRDLIESVARSRVRPSACEDPLTSFLPGLLRFVPSDPNAFQLNPKVGGAIEWRSPPRTANPLQTGLAQGLSLLLFDFAVQLAEIVNRFSITPPEVNVSATYYLSVDALEIDFTRTSGVVRITSNEDVDRGWAIEVPSHEFDVATRPFLQSFAAAIQAQAPALLNWEESRVLLTYFGVQ